MLKANFAIIVSRFNEHLTSRLLEGATHFLLKSGVPKENVKTYFVPGAFEIPTLARKLALSETVDAIIALGCVIRGETIHFDVICRTTAASLQQISMETGKAITSGILMVEDEAQALARLGGGHGNRGEEAAKAALEMVQILRNLPASE